MNDKRKSNPSSTLTLKSWAISRTSLWNGSFLISSSVLFWYLRISLQRTSRPLIKQGNKRPTNKKNRKYVSYRRATVPGRYRWGFFTPPVVGADFRAAWKTQCQLIWIWQELVPVCISIKFLEFPNNPFLSKELKLKITLVNIKKEAHHQTTNPLIWQEWVLVCIISIKFLELPINAFLSKELKLKIILLNINKRPSSNKLTLW